MEPEIRLDALEGRLLGVLVEKALTTPEQYPLTLNAAVNGANQKSNRDPVLALGEDEALAALDRLIGKELVRRVFPGSSRVDKYCHTGTSTLKVEVPTLATLAELLLRGPQTAAELRLRVSRMTPIESPDRMHEILRGLLDRGLARRLHGSRAERYAQLLTGDPETGTTRIGNDPALRTEGSFEQGPGGDLAQRMDAVEAELDRLRRQLHELAARLGETLE
jgi:uncharacterized protein YceH (UPF0502 family)